MSDVLTILGRGDSWEACPYEGEIWACASVLITEGMENRHYDKVFAVDKESESETVRKSIKVARERGIPVVSPLSYGDEKYPTYEIYSAFKTNYLRNTASFMLALAVYQNRSPVEIFGIDQTGDYIRTKPFITFWLGVAVGRGLEFNIHSSSLMPIRMEFKEGTQRLKEQTLKGMYGERETARINYERYLETKDKKGDYTLDDFIRAEREFNKGLRQNREPWLD